MNLTFNPDRHEYQLDGRVIPGVTQVISTIQLWNGMPPDVLEHARERGSKVDRAVNLYDGGGLCIDEIEDEIVPYVLAWSRLKRDKGITIIASQLAGHNSTYMYGGTLDKIVEIDGMPSLIEVKATDKIEPEAALQTAGYEHMHEVQDLHLLPRGKLFPRFTAQLKPDATYRLHPWKDRADISTFLAALTLMNWRKQ